MYKSLFGGQFDIGLFDLVNDLSKSEVEEFVRQYLAIKENTSITFSLFWNSKFVVKMRIFKREKPQVTVFYEKL